MFLFFPSYFIQVQKCRNYIADVILDSCSLKPFLITANRKIARMSQAHDLWAAEGVFSARVSMSQHTVPRVPKSLHWAAPRDFGQRV